MSDRHLLIFFVLFFFSLPRDKEEPPSKSQLNNSVVKKRREKNLVRIHTLVVVETRKGSGQLCEAAVNNRTEI